MTRENGPATRFAETRTGWVEDDWWLLEEAAFSQHRETRIAILGNAPARLLHKAPTRGGIPKWLAPFVTALILVEIAAPVLAGVMIFGWLLNGLTEGGLFDGTADEMLLVPAGFLGGLATILGVKTALMSRRSNATGESSTSNRIMALLYLIPGVPATVVAIIGLLSGTEADQPAWVAGLIAQTLFGFYLLWLHHRTGGEKELKFQPAVDRAVARLTPVQQHDVVEDLEQALLLLQQKGILEPALVQNARNQPLGRLGATFASTRADDIARRTGRQQQ